MEQSKALHKLSEASDLMLMLEDTLASGNSDRVAATSWAGIRIIMKSVRETIQQSHAVLAQDLITRSKEVKPTVHAAPGLASKVETPQPVINSAQTSPIQQTVTDANGKAMISRRDLKASLERFIESQ